MTESEINPVADVANYVRCENIEEVIKGLLRSKEASEAFQANFYPISKLTSQMLKIKSRENKHIFWILR